MIKKFQAIIEISPYFKGWFPITVDDLKGVTTLANPMQTVLRYSLVNNISHLQSSSKLTIVVHIWLENLKYIIKVLVWL